MKRLSLALIPALALGLAACQKQAAPERTADAAPAATAAPAAPAVPARPAIASHPRPVEPAPPAKAPVATVPAEATPAPTPRPTPTPRPRVVAAGTALPIVLKEGLTTKTAKPEDPVVAELAEDVVVDGDVLLPAGSGSSKGRDAKVAGGAAAAGAIIGAIADGGSGAVKGGIIGGAAGGAAVLATRGQEVELPAGSRYKIELRKSLRLN